MKSIGEKMSHDPNAADRRYISLEKVREVASELERQSVKYGVEQTYAMITAEIDDLVSMDSVLATFISTDEDGLNSDELVSAAREFIDDENQVHITDEHYLIAMVEYKRMASKGAGIIPIDGQIGENEFLCQIMFADMTMAIFSGYIDEKDKDRNMKVKMCMSNADISFIDPVRSSSSFISPSDNLSDPELIENRIYLNTPQEMYLAITKLTSDQ